MPALSPFGSIPLTNTHPRHERRLQASTARKQETTPQAIRDREGWRLAKSRMKMERQVVLLCVVGLLDLDAYLNLVTAVRTRYDGYRSISGSLCAGRLSLIGEEVSNAAADGIGNLAQGVDGDVAVRGNEVG